MITYKRYHNPKFFSKTEVKSDSFKGLEDSNHVFLNAVRTGLLGIFDLLEFKKGDTILLPAFSPHGLFLPCKKKGLNVLFYNLNPDLTPNKLSVENHLNTNDVKAIFFIHYFGYYKDFSDLAVFAKSRGTLVFEDCAHSLFHDYKKSHMGKIGDISFFSMNKILPVPDGSIFISNNPSIDLKKINLKKSLFATISVRCNYYHLFLRTKEIEFYKRLLLRKTLSFLSASFYAIYYITLCHTNYPAPMSSLTKKTLHKMQLDKLIRVRISNLKYVNNLLNIDFEQKKFEGIVTGIPFLTKDTQNVRKKLQDLGIQTLAYNKKWWFVPKDQIKNYKTEFDYHNQHFLIPVNENLSEDELAFMAKHLKQI